MKFNVEHGQTGVWSNSNAIEQIKKLKVNKFDENA